MKTFLEIGTADFDTLIPLAEKGGWCGWCVEPVPKHVRTLEEKTKTLPVGIIPYAISDHDGHVNMHVGGGGDWAEGASHVCDANHEGARLLELPGNVKLNLREDTIKVPCMKLDTLVAMYDLKKIDYMKIDVEGHELQVLRGYSWDVKPKFIKAEHKHISGDELGRILYRQGYTIWSEIDDLYAIL
jgi:FkbM family methyltransferase